MIIFLVAILVVGPEDLPKVAKWLGQRFRALRLLVKEIKSEVGWNELEKEINATEGNINREIKSLESEIDMTRDIKSTSDKIEDNLQEINKFLDINK